MEHIFKTLSPVNLGLQNFPGPLAHTIRTGTYQSPPGTVLEQIWPQGAEQSRFLSKYFWKKRIAFSPRFSRLLSYKVLLFERRWISVSTSHFLEKSSFLNCCHTRPQSIQRLRIQHTRHLSIHRLRIHSTRPWPSESTKLERESKFRCHEKIFAAN